MIFTNVLLPLPVLPIIPNRSPILTLRSILFKLKSLMNKLFKKDDKNLELEIVMLKMLLSQKELDFTLLKAQYDFELTVLKNEINQFNLQKIIDHK